MPNLEEHSSCASLQPFPLPLKLFPTLHLFIAMPTQTSLTDRISLFKPVFVYPPGLLFPPCPIEPLSSSGSEICTLREAKTLLHPRLFKGVILSSPTNVSGNM